jgi:carboxylesterase type B
LIIDILFYRSQIVFIWHQIDDSVVFGQSQHLMKAGNWNKMPIMFGYTKDESAGFVLKAQAEISR